MLSVVLPSTSIFWRLNDWVFAVRNEAVPPLTTKLPLTGAFSEEVGAMFRSPRAPLTKVPAMVVEVARLVAAKTPVRLMIPSPLPLMVMTRAVASLERLMVPESVSWAPEERLL